MAEVHLLFNDRRIIAEAFRGCETRPPPLSPGQWHRLKQADLDFMDLQVFLDLWDLFPRALKLELQNGKRTAPNDNDYPTRTSSGTGSRGNPRLLPPEDRRPWEWEDW